MKWFIVITVVSLLIAALRVGGIHTPAYQAVAHLWVAGLIGYGIATGDRPVYALAAFLCVVEVVVFALSL